MVLNTLVFGLAVITIVWSSQPSRAIAEEIIDADILDITEKILAADDNGFKYGDVRTLRYERPLFKTLDKAFLKRDTYARMKTLFDKYVPFWGVAEKSGCEKEEYEFIDAILQTKPIKTTYEWLAKRKLASTTIDGFRNQLYQYWFTRYSRLGDGKLDSSGFEHTFVGEIGPIESDRINLEVKGLHNWVRMYLEEKRESPSKKLKGLNVKTRDPTCPNSVEAIAFQWLRYDKNSGQHRNYFKPRSAVLIGTSPEVEIALSTICLLTRPSHSSTPKSSPLDCPIRLPDKTVLRMNTFVKYIQSGKYTYKTISSTYPVC